MTQHVGSAHVVQNVPSDGIHVYSTFARSHGHGRGQRSVRRQSSGGLAARKRSID